MTLSIIYWLSFISLLVTKAADVVSTLRFVSASSEANPWARRLFLRFGFKRGLMFVSAVFLAIVVSQYAVVWLYCPAWMQTANACLGFMISFIQWDVARFNATGTHSKITLLAMRSYRGWSRRWRR